MAATGPSDTREELLVRRKFLSTPERDYKAPVINRARGFPRFAVLSRIVKRESVENGGWESTRKNLRNYDAPGISSNSLRDSITRLWKVAVEFRGNFV